MDWCAYLRTSGEVQRDRVTIALQIEKIQQWASSTGAHIAEWYADDGVKSEIPVALRPAGGRMFREAALGQWQGIVVYDTDRWGRDPAVNHPAMKAVRDMGLAFVDLSSPGTDFHTDEGELMFTVKSGVARYEHRKILRRMKDGRDTVVKQGAWVGGIVPYGYGLIVRHKRKFLLVSETQIEGFPQWSEAEVIRRIFHWITVECMACRAVAARLNDLGVPTHACLRGRPNNRQDGATRGVWHHAAVRAILTNPVYKGVHYYGPQAIEREQPAIVSAATWQQAQEQLPLNRTHAKRNRKQPYLLAGKLICAECGHHYVGTRQPYGRPEKNGWGYVCAGRKSGKDYGYPCKQAKGIREWVEERVWEKVRWFIDHPEEVIDLLLAEITTESQGANRWQEEQDALIRAQGEIEKRRRRAEDAYLAGSMPLSRYQERLQEFDTEEARLEEQIGSYQERIDALAAMDEQLEAVGDAIEGLRAVTANATWEEKRMAILALVDRVEVGTAAQGRGTRPPLTVVIAWHRFLVMSSMDTTLAGAVHNHNQRWLLRLAA